MANGGFRFSKEKSFSEVKQRTSLARVGDGNIIFWSVMPFSKLKDGQKLYMDGIDDE